jgi:hypothetical protein
LESAEVRGAVIDALYNFIEDERPGPSVRAVIRRHVEDADDEVRDRATFYTEVLSTGYTDLLGLCGLAAVEEAGPVAGPPEVDVAGDLVMEGNLIKATSDDDELVVVYKAKLFRDRISLIFTIRNTFGAAIEKVSIERLKNHDRLEPSSATTCELIESNSEGTITLTYDGTWEDPMMLGGFGATVVFHLEDDPNAEQTYDLPNGADLKISAFMLPTRINDFDSSFAQMLCQAKDNFKFERARTQDDAIKAFNEAVGLAVMKTEKVTVEARRNCCLARCAGLAFGTDLVLATLLIPQPLKSGGIIVNVTIKAHSQALIDAVVRSFD